MRVEMSRSAAISRDDEMGRARMKKRNERDDTFYLVCLASLSHVGGRGGIIALADYPLRARRYDGAENEPH